MVSRELCFIFSHVGEFSTLINAEIMLLHQDFHELYGFLVGVTIKNEPQDWMAGDAKHLTELIQLASRFSFANNGFLWNLKFHSTFTLLRGFICFTTSALCLTLKLFKQLSSQSQQSKTINEWLPRRKSWSHVSNYFVVPTTFTTNSK